MNELETLLAEKDITINDKKVIIKRYSFISTLKLASRTSGLVAKIMNNSEVASSAISKLTLDVDDSSTGYSLKMIGMAELLSILEEDSVEFIKDCISFATNDLTDEEIEDLDPDVGIELLLDICEVNKGFFMKCLTKLTKITETPKTKKKK